MNSHISELIDRHLDQSATLEESAELFAAMEADPAVRQEFQAASAIHDLIASDVAATPLPAGLYSSIVEAATIAGALPTAAVSTAVTAGVAASTSSGVASAVSATASGVGAAIGTTGSVIMGVIATAAVAVVSVVTYTSMNEESALSTTPVAPSAPIPIIIHDAAPPNPPEVDNNVTSSFGGDKAVFPAGTEQTIGNRSTVRSTRITDNDGTFADASSSVDDETESSLEIQQVSLRSSHNVLHRSPSHETESSAVTSLNDELASMFGAASDKSSFEVRLSGSPLVSYDYNAEPTDQWQNAGLSALYHLNEDHAVGIAVRHDVFPVVVLRNGIETDERTMTWFAAQYRFAPSINLPLDVQPFAQIMVGGSSKGAMIVPAVGLQRSFGIASVGVGVDVSNLVYQNAGTVGTATRTGLYLDLGIRW